MIRLLTWLIFILLLVGIVRCVQAAEPDVIQLDDNCKLVKKPEPKATVLKRRPLVVQFAKPAAVAASQPKVVKKRKKPIFKADIPANYELNCDETPPLLERFTAPPTEADAAPPVIPFGTLPMPPSEFTLPPEPGEDTPLYAVPGEPIGVMPYPPPTGGYYAPLAPIPPVPEPETWLLLIVGLAFYRKFK